MATTMDYVVYIPLAASSLPFETRSICYAIGSSAVRQRQPGFSRVIVEARATNNIRHYRLSYFTSHNRVPNYLCKFSDFILRQELTQVVNLDIQG
jgi:hypothetical protein